MLHKKKVLSLLLCAGLLAGLFPTGARAEEVRQEEPPQAAETAAAGDVVIDEATFPDENFRNYVRTLPGAEDGVFTQEELRIFGTINCHNSDISDLTGIEVFKNVTELYCSGNQLTELNLSEMSSLFILDCSGNQLTELGLTGLPRLRNLDYSGNQLTELNLSELPSLYNLNCSGNQLTELNLSNLPSLRNLDCSGNQLTELNLPELPQLSGLDCSGNQLTRLNLPELPRLSDLDCSDNQLTELSLSDLPSLYYLTCSGNRLTDLDASNLLTQGMLDCSDNQLTTLIFPQNSKCDHLECSENHLTKLDVVGCQNLQILNCADNQLTELDVGRNSKLETLHCENNHLATLYVGWNPSLTELDCSGNVYETPLVSGLKFSKLAMFQIEDDTLSGGHLENGALCFDEGSTSMTYRCMLGRSFYEQFEIRHVHSFDSVWHSDETGHWHACACGGKDAVEAHTYGDWVITDEPGLNHDGSRVRTCMVCGFKETESLPGTHVERFPIRAEFIKKGWTGDRVTALTVQPDGSIQAPKTSGRHFYWRSEDGQLAVKAKGTLTYDQLLEVLGGSAPSGAVIRFRMADDRVAAARTVTVRFLSGDTVVSTAAVETAESENAVQAEQLEQYLPADYAFAETVDAYPIGDDDTVQVPVLDAALVSRPVRVTFRLSGPGHLQGARGKTMEVSLTAGESLVLPAAESSRQEKSVTWTSQETGQTFRSGEILTYELLQELLGEPLPDDPQLTFTAAVKRR